MIQLALAISLLFPAQSARERTPERIQIIRSEVGPKGATKGDTFVFDEQRDSFDLAADKEVIVAFEWEAAPGNHRCELSWIAPDGTVALKAMLDLPAKGRRFSGYWSLLLNPTMARGLWAAEVKVNGIPAGSRTFRIQGPPIARPLPPDELYKLASETTLSIESRLPPGAERRVFSGFALSSDAVITTLAAINAAASLKITFADGSHVETDEVWLYSRELDWVLLKAPVPATQAPLKVAASAKVGDPCAFLNIIEGQRELAPCSILGQNKQSSVTRFSISNRPALAAFGAPLLSAVGEVIGMVGTDQQPGGASFEDGGAYRVGSRGAPSTLLVLPVQGIRRPEGAEPSKLADFWTRGLFFKLVTAGRHVSHGFISAGASGPRGEGVRSASGFEFYPSDGILTALLRWQPREKLATTLNHGVFDMANRMIVLGKPLKADFKPGVPVDSSSQIDVSRYPPGEYRLDVLLGDEVAWRTFFKIRP